MSTPDFSSPREEARAFTPKLAALVEQPLFSEVGADPDLAPRDRSIANLSGADRHGSVRAEAGRSAACAQQRRQRRRVVGVDHPSRL
jgi:hypothetical protein